MTAQDDGSIAGTDRAYRRVHPDHAPPDLHGVPRLSSAAFKLRESDAGHLSVYLESELGKIPAVPADCTPAGSTDTIAELDVAGVRALGHGVLRDPILHAEKSNICDPAHAVITGFADKRKAWERQARDLRDLARWPTR